MRFKKMLANNLLDHHPEGLGKHIFVAQNDRNLSEEQVLELFNNGQIPFFFNYNDTYYLVILGSDIVGHNDDIHVNKMVDKIKSLSFYIDQMYHFLNIPKEKVVVYYIGHSDE